ncbi:MAG: HAD-IIB family hydrolase [Candidatus Pacebacteria bacterium]|nr:HAD-IIB family hydrolase [Candidatus Paceibacterota bacterium]
MDFKPKLMAFDLDGTLAESKQRLSADMGEQFAELLEVMPAAILSGAGFDQFENQFLPALPAEAKLEKLFLFPTNGAECMIYKDGVWKAKYDLSFNLMERGRIMQALKESLAESGLSTIPEYTEEWGNQIEDRGAQITFSALGQKAPIEIKRAWDPNRTKRKPLYDALKRRLPDFSIGLNASTSIDITKKGVNKAYGIRKLIELTGISVSEMLYVGDALEEGGNDSVVVQTGIKTHEVFGPDETARLIGEILRTTRHMATA